MMSRWGLKSFEFWLNSDLGFSEEGYSPVLDSLHIVFVTGF
jgi:hypothetical protein